MLDTVGNPENSGGTAVHSDIHEGADGIQNPVGVTGEGFRDSGKRAAAGCNVMTFERDGDALAGELAHIGGAASQVGGISPVCGRL